MELDLEGDLIGFKNNVPVTKKPGNLGGKVIILQGNKTNVRIPAKLCETVPESLRKNLLGKLNIGNPLIRQKELGVDKKPYLAPRDKAPPPIVRILDVSLPRETPRTPSEAKMSQAPRRKKFRVVTHRQTIQREVMKCLRQTARAPEVRSISCQTRADSRDASVQTEPAQAASPLATPSIDALNLELCNFFDLPMGAIDPEEQLNPAALDPRKRAMYECFVGCDKVNTSGDIPLHAGVLENNPIEVSNQCLMLAAKKVSVDVQNNQGLTPLNLAVLNSCDPQIVKTMLDRGANPLIRDNEGNTPLHNAVLHNETVDALTLLLTRVDLEESSDAVDAFNYEGFTPLMLCVVERKDDMARRLVEFGADPNKRDQKSGRTSLFHAVETNNLCLVKLFLANGADTRIKNFFGTSPHEATFELENIDTEIKGLVVSRNINNGAAAGGSAQHRRPRKDRAREPPTTTTAVGYLPTQKRFKQITVLKMSTAGKR